MTLLDVSLLVALCDADHVHHGQARQWFRANAPAGWATAAATWPRWIPAWIPPEFAADRRRWLSSPTDAAGRSGRSRFNLAPTRVSSRGATALTDWP